MRPLLIRRILVASSVTLAIHTTSVEAALVLNVMGYPDPNYGTPEQSFRNWSTDRANFTMLDSGGYIVGGTNDIAMVWDGNAYNASSDYSGPGSAANVTVSSTTSFFGHIWAAYDIQMFMPGSYSFDTTAGGSPSDTETGFLNVTVGSGQIGMHVLFDFKTNDTNIDMFVVFSLNSVFGPGIARSSNITGCDATANATIQNCLWDAPGYVSGNSANKPAGSTVWMLASSDGNGDGVMGIPMVSGGSFEGFNANFNANLSPTLESIPLPAAVWLFGSGLLGLIGVARRRMGVRHN